MARPIIPWLGPHLVLAEPTLASVPTRLAIQSPGSARILKRLPDRARTKGEQP